MLVKCSAKTCTYYKNGMCNAEAIEMIDFDYYASVENQRREIPDDEMKCNSYKSKNDRN